MKTAIKPQASKKKNKKKRFFIPTSVIISMSIIFIIIMYLLGVADRNKININEKSVDVALGLVAENWTVRFFL